MISINLYNLNNIQTMSDFEHKYQQQKRKCDNLLKMQTSIFNDIDEYSKAIFKIRNSIRFQEGQQQDQNQQLTPEMANQYADEAVAYINKLGRPCECNRWKGLYQRESEETLKLNRYIEELQQKIKEKEDQESKDRIEIGQLLNDYLDLFQKQFCPIKEQKENEQKREKKEVSRSKSKNKNTSQTERKNAKNMSNYEIGGKEEAYIKLIVDKLEKDLQSLHGEVETLRDKNISLQQILRIYRAKERQHLLNNQCKWFQ